MGLLYVSLYTRNAHLYLSHSSGLVSVPPWATSLTVSVFPICTVRGLDCMTSTSNGFETLKVRFPPLCRCTCRKGYVGDGSTCYGNIMERLRELNTEPGGKWQGRLTSFISLLGTQPWVHISTERAVLWWARTSARHTITQKGVCRIGKSCLLGSALSRKGKWEEKDK